MFEIRVVPARCHVTCLDVIGPDDHVANINPIGMTDPVLWRIDCDYCATCIRAGFATRDEAVTMAKKHVLLSADGHWRALDALDVGECFCDSYMYVTGDCPIHDTQIKE